MLLSKGDRRGPFGRTVRARAHGRMGVWRWLLPDKNGRLKKGYGRHYNLKWNHVAFGRCADLKRGRFTSIANALTMVPLGLGGLACAPVNAPRF